MSTAAKMSSIATASTTTTFASQPHESSVTESHVEVERLFPRCLSSPKAPPTTTESTTAAAGSTPSSSSTGKKKTKKKKAGSGAIKTKKVCSITDKCM